MKFRTDPRLGEKYDRLHLTNLFRDNAVIFNSHRHPDYTEISSGVGVNTTLTDATSTISVTTSGLTITLPPASNDRIGQDWTVHLGVAGNVTIQRHGSDTICTSVSATDTSIQITTLGNSLTFRCLTSTSWILV